MGSGKGWLWKMVLKIAHCQCKCLFFVWKLSNKSLLLPILLPRKEKLYSIPESSTKLKMNSYCFLHIWIVHFEISSQPLILIAGRDMLLEEIFINGLSHSKPKRCLQGDVAGLQLPSHFVFGLNGGTDGNCSPLTSGGYHVDYLGLQFKYAQLALIVQPLA